MQKIKQIPIWVWIICASVALILLYLSYSRMQPKMILNTTVFDIEVMVSDTEKAKGLSGRNSLADKHGMLFVYPNAAEHTFWMNGMNFPLDFLWIRDKTIMDITENVHPNTENPEKTVIKPKTSVNLILEIPAGSVKEYGLEIGQLIRFKL
jgi:uncharacterized protein